MNAECEHNETEMKYEGNYRVHCCKCGRFVGKAGFIDISYDSYIGGYEEGYSLCAACLKEKTK